VVGGDEAKRGVYLGTFDNPSSRRILTDQSSSVLFVPSASGIGHGYLLFLRETTLMAQPFDPTTLQLAGDVFPVAGQASTSSSPPQMAATASQNGILVYLANSTLESQLTWFDRSGKAQAKIGPHSLLSAVSLSPDEKIVAFDSRSGMWLHELNRGVETKFTFPPLGGGGAVWSPDGGRMAFSITGGLYRKDASGGGQEEVLLKKGSNPRALSDWSRDGRFLLYTEDDPKTRGDLWILPDPLGKSGGGTPVPFLRTEFIESQGQFSPDGRWIAYVSNETSQPEVYVRPFPSGAGKWKVSTNGGVEPRWRRDGKELFYLQPDGLLRRLMVAGIQPASRPVFEVGAPKPLFAARLISFVIQSNAFSYSVSADGQRFLMNTQVSVVEPTLNVIVNWEKVAAAKER
jgi:dipeptidyl aminopeptidase/acylaminoacyl peptidase